MADATIISQFSDQVSNLITKRAIIRAKNMIQKFNGETDAILLSEGLEQTRKMLVIMEEEIVLGSSEADMIIDAFRLRWLLMDRILLKARGKRPAPVWTDKDRKTYMEIKATARKIFGNALPVGNIVPLLLEVNHE